MIPKARRRAREWALRTLYQLELSEIGLQEAFESARESHKNADEEYAHFLCEGVSAASKQLDEEVARLAHGYSLDRIAAIDLVLIKIALYEMKQNGDVPNAVAINEAVELAKKYSTEQSGLFINGILGAALAEQASNQGEPHAG